MKTLKKKLEIYALVSMAILLLAVLVTFLLCRWAGESFFDSWASSMGETGVAGALLILQGRLIQKISKLIKDIDLDLVPVRGTFCENLSVVGFIFLVQCGDFAVHIIASIFLDKSTKEQEEANSTLFILIAITVQICLLCAYFSFFMLIFRSTNPGRTFPDLILGQEVPELVYL